MSNKILELRIDEVSVVDAGANPEAWIVLWKRAPTKKAEDAAAEPSPNKCPECDGELFLAVPASDNTPELWQCNGACEATPAFERHGNQFTPVKRASAPTSETMSDVIKRQRAEDRRLAKLLNQQPDEDEEPMDREQEIAKSLADDVSKGTISSVVKADVEGLVKSRAESRWRARGCPPDGRLTALAEAESEALDPWLPVSASNPTLGKLYSLAPESREVTKARGEILEEREQLEQQLAAMIEKAEKEHPDWSRIRVLDHVHMTDAGMRCYQKYLRLGEKLGRAQ